MTRGSADFSNVQNNGINFSVAPTWENSNRPSGILSLDLRGECIYYNEFETGDNGVGYTTVNPPVYNGISVNSVYQGAFSVRLATNATINSLVIVQKDVVFNGLTQCGFETRVYANQDNTKIRINNEYSDGSLLWRGRIFINTQTKAITYRDSSGVEQAIPGNVESIHLLNDFVYYKLVIDFVNKKYVRFIQGSQIIDMSDIVIGSQATVNNGIFSPSVGLENLSGVSREIYVDNMLVTVNEP